MADTHKKYKCATAWYDILHIHCIEEEFRHKASLESKDDLLPVPLREVQTLIKSLETKKSPRLDGISNKAIKCFFLFVLGLLVAQKLLLPSHLEKDRGVQLAFFADDTALNFHARRQKPILLHHLRAFDEQITATCIFWGDTTIFALGATHASYASGSSLTLISQPLHNSNTGSIGIKKMST
ncbi:hypothetical protein EVAR_79962_1 [Eumeta japonica]|uniref:Uncharacterized protein n=1 Tax=Eumeta variegata TaxID=151549 RepID=A0A4C1Y5B3_EUMVA|nr:hypothetical protein EVAR_79962_1 [Eumeta japonica]